MAFKKINLLEKQDWESLKAQVFKHIEQDAALLHKNRMYSNIYSSGAKDWAKKFLDLLHHHGAVLKQIDSLSSVVDDLLKMPSVGEHMSKETMTKINNVIALSRANYREYFELPVEDVDDTEQ